MTILDLIDTALPQVPYDVNNLIYSFTIPSFEFRVEFDSVMMDLLHISIHGCNRPSHYKYFSDERSWQRYLRQSNRQDEMLIWDETITELAFDDWLAQREE